MYKKQNEFSRFHLNSANVSVPHCHVIRTLFILCIIMVVLLEKLMRHRWRAVIAAVEISAITVFVTCYNITKCCILL